MLRPLQTDILHTAIPLVVGLAMFCVGRLVLNGPRGLSSGVIGLGLVALFCGAGSLTPWLPPQLAVWISLIGGATILLCWTALLILGFIWSAPRKSLSPTFLACLATLASLVLLIECSGWVLWRYFMTDMWDRTANAEGYLRQSNGLTCSPAAAVMLLHYHGIKAGEGEMAYLAGTSVFGTEVHAMAEALSAKLEDRGWRAVAGVREYADCLHRQKPFIAHIHTELGGHAVFVLKIDSHGVIVIDPVEGQRIAFPREIFKEVWDGTVVEIVDRNE